MSTSTGSQAASTSVTTAILDSRQVAKEFGTISLTSEIRPPVFSGKAEDVLRWAARFETVARALEWDDARKLNQVPLYLSGFASVWLDHATNKGNKPFSTCDACKDDLVRRFMPADYKRQLKSRIRQRRLHRDEDVAEYFNDILTMCYQLHPKILNEDVVDKLRDGLFADLYSKVVMSKSKTPVDFYADLIIASGAIKKENLMRDKYSTNKSFSRYTNPPISKARDVKSGNTTRTEYGKTGQAVAKEVIAKSSYGGFGRSTALQKKCYNCGGPHLMRNCPKNRPLQQRREVKVKGQIHVLEVVNDGQPSTSSRKREDDPTDGGRYQLLRLEDDVLEVVREHHEWIGERFVNNDTSESPAFPDTSMNFEISLHSPIAQVEEGTDDTDSKEVDAAVDAVANAATREPEYGPI